MEQTDCQHVARWTSLQKIVLAAVLLSVFILHAFLLRTGHDWGGDFAQYLSHARNIATGQSYADTGYVYNPDAAVIGPRAYPPIFPLFLAAFYAIFGADLTAIRLGLVALFVGMIFVSSLLFARKLSAWTTIGVAMLIGFCPLFWEFNQTIDSEHLFVFWWMLLMWFYTTYRGDTENKSDSLWVAIVAGLLVYLAIGTRTVGIVLPPAILLTETITYRRLTRFTIVSLVAAILFYAIQKLLLPLGGSGYLDQLSQINATTLSSNLFADSLSFLFVWKNGYYKYLAAGAGLGFSLIAIGGFIKENWPRPTLLAIASILHFVLVVVWPGANGIRMVWPLLPAFLYWLLYACENLPVSKLWRTSGIAAVIGYSLLCFTGEYVTAEYGPIAGPESPASQALFAEVEQTVPNDQVCLFFKPRVLAFYTRRNCTGYPIPLDEASLTRTIEQADVDVVITTSDQPEKLPAWLTEAGFSVAWQNDEFQIWRK